MGDRAARRRAQGECHRGSALFPHPGHHGDAIVTSTLDGIITGWNPGAERLFGYGASESIGRAIDMIVPEDRKEEVQSILRRIGCGEVIQHHDTVRLRKDGGRIDVSLSISP